MKIKSTRIQVARGSLINQNVDVIVNAAKPTLRGGGGIDGLIHNSAGRELDIYEFRHFPNGTIVGEAVITPAFNLPQKAIIHVPGPIYAGGELDEAKLLCAAYNSSLELGRDFKYKSIGFCSISTGIYGYPLVDAAKIAINTITSFVAHAEHRYTNIVLAMYGEEEYNVFKQVLEDKQKEHRQMRRKYLAQKAKFTGGK